MRNPLDLRLVDADNEPRDEPSTVAAAPNVFARAVSTPPGWPWEQARGALLEARHGAPLPIDQMLVRLKRLTPWRLRQGGRFAACYVRTSEIETRFEARVEVDDQAVSVTFEPPEAMARRARRSLVAGVAAAGIAALVFMSIAGALLARSEGETQLAAMERDAAAKLRRAETAQRVRRESAALTMAQPGDRIAAPLTDLAWAMAARAPDARIESWNWAHGVSRVEARGETSPFADPQRGASREGVARPGVWSWRIQPEGAGR
ncbi:hypothetical protein [Caulobacter sp. LARHSG274]